MGNWLGWVAVTSFLGLRCEGCRGFADFIVLGTAACSGPTVTFGANFAVLTFLVVVASVLGLSVTGSGAGLGGGGIAALTTQPPRTTWFQSGPRISCSPDVSSPFAFGAVGGMGVTPALLLSVGACLASATLASLQFTQPR